MEFSSWLAGAALVISVATATFTHFRWRQERRPRLLVRLAREPHSEGDHPVYVPFAKLWVEIYNDGGRAAEGVTMESKGDFQKHNENLASGVAFKADFLKPGESGTVLLGRDREVRWPHPGLGAFEVVARCKGLRCRWEFTLDPASVLPRDVEE